MRAADENRGSTKIIAEEGLVDGCLGLLVNVPSRVGDHSDDLELLVGEVEADVFADGIVFREKLLRSFVGYDRDFAACEALIGCEDPAAHQRNLCGRKVARIRGAHVQVDEVFLSKREFDYISETVTTPALTGRCADEPGAI